MSVRTMARVWQDSRHSGSDLLMLLAISDFADDDGRAYPSVETLAAKCRMKSRNANYVLRTLRASGELEILANKGPNGTNVYRVVLERLGLQAVAPPPLQPGAPLQSVAPLQSMVSTPAIHGTEPLQPVADKPSGTTKEPSKRERARKTALPDDFGVSERVKTWATKNGHTRLDERLEAFKGKAIAKGYRYADWDQAFINSIRDDWANLTDRPGKRKAGDKSIAKAWEGVDHVEL